MKLALCLALFLTACHRAPTPPQPPATTATPTNGRVAISVDADGYHPATVNAPAGRPLTLVFTRTTDDGCGQQVVFPATNVRRDLPLHQPVAITVTPSAGTLSFTCGMGMYLGSVVAR